MTSNWIRDVEFNRFLVFEDQQFDASGGILDFKKSFATLEEAKVWCESVWFNGGFYVAEYDGTDFHPVWSVFELSSRFERFFEDG